MHFKRKLNLSYKLKVTNNVSRETLNTIKKENS